MNLGKSIKVALAKAGMNQRQLADQMGLSHRFVTELANKPSGSFANVERLAKAFGMKPSEFISLGEE